MKTFSTTFATAIAFIALCLAGGYTSFAQDNTENASDKKKVNKIEGAEFGEAPNVHQCGSLIFAGQFQPDDVELLSDKKVTRVITLRTEGEIDWDEKAKVEAAKVEFIEVPFRSPESLNDEVFDKIRSLLADEDKVTLFHCGSANRVGGVWLPYRVLDQGVDLKTAIDEARQIGLKNEAYEQKALNYIERKLNEKQSEAGSNRPQSVRPGINKDFVDADLDVDTYVQRFEIESREVFSARNEILKACDINPGDRIADIGAGTGLFTRMFSATTGDDGWVYAVDIAPRFIQHINGDADKFGLKNITGVLCQEDSCNLPKLSIDIAFICDTYHHFEYPDATMKSIHRALKDDGQVVIVDFERIPGKTREWTLNHVRAGKDVVQKEIEAAGFELVDEIKVAGLEENYCLRFKKK